MKNCSVCGKNYDETAEPASVYAEAGEWLAGEMWQDKGELCPGCLESRAKLAMMYCRDLDG
jgi:hypothetical protein